MNSNAFANCVMMIAFKFEAARDVVHLAHDAYERLSRDVVAGGGKDQINTISNHGRKSKRRSVLKTNWKMLARGRRAQKVRDNNCLYVL